MRVVAVIGNSGVVPELEKPVKNKIRDLISKNHIITGGATGVDTFVLETALEQRHTKNLTIYLTDPTERLDEAYEWKEEYEDNEQIRKELDRSKMAVRKFIKIQPMNVVEKLGKKRNKSLAQDADEIIAFMSRISKGTLETIQYAEELKKNVTVFDKNGNKLDKSKLDV